MKSSPLVKSPTIEERSENVSLRSAESVSEMSEHVFHPAGLYRCGGSTSSDEEGGKRGKI